MQLWLIPLLPLAGAAINGLTGRRTSKTVQSAVAIGSVLLEVAVTAPADTFPQNNQNGAIVTVGAAPSLLVIAPEIELGEYFAKALKVQNLEAKVIAPKDAPTSIDKWLVYDAVVLMNMPAIALATDQQEALEQYVEVHGRGLLMLGGENSFGPGGYYETPLERLSPLSSRVPHDRPQVAMVFVLDRSGSMTAPADESGRLTRLGKLDLPGSLPAMFTGFRISAGLSVVGAIVGEFFFKSGVQGIGTRIQLYTNRSETAKLIAAISLTAALGISLATAKRDWAYARAWLFQEVRQLRP